MAVGRRPSTVTLMNVARFLHFNRGEKERQLYMQRRLRFYIASCTPFNLRVKTDRYSLDKKRNRHFKRT